MNAQDTSPALRRQELYNIRFYEKSDFNGSLKGMNYRIGKVSDDGGDHFKVTIWQGPINFYHTDDSLKVNAEFPFANEALDDITDYLIQYHGEHFK